MTQSHRVLERAEKKLVFVCAGEPGSGKTEAVIGCALEAAGKGERVLIACPIGALVDTYRQKLPPNDHIVIETIHASHRITRKADEVYVPPGRLRHFDLIIYDEISQIEGAVWEQVRTALVELNPHPFVCFVGDFQQLQPTTGDVSMQSTLTAMSEAGTLRHIQLQQHEFARSTDPQLLDFLRVVRAQQPSRDTLQSFFGARRLAPNDSKLRPESAIEVVKASMAFEERTEKTFTFLTVTNKAALKLNHTRCLLQFGARPEVQSPEYHAMPGDPDYGGRVLVLPGLRIRLTRNIDKDRGFVNGALAEVEHVLAKNVFVAKTPKGVRLLVHPIRQDGHYFMPFTYGYAMTMRRAQGSTLEGVGLWFDHKYPPERGYGYVGASRVRRAEDLYLVGKVRQTDWLPVGVEMEGERLRRGAESEDTPSASSSAAGSEDQGETGSSNEEDLGAESDSCPDSPSEDQGESNNSSAGEDQASSA